MNINSFDAVKDQIGFCGIWCGSCIVGNGTLRKLTKKYEDLIKNYDLESWAPKAFDFKEFLKGLGVIRKTPLCPGCKKGGGWEECPIRVCASRKNLAECVECPHPAACENPEALHKMRNGSKRARLFVKTYK
ncbi:MAG: DUF3795 domain-containing protein, partial [Acidobacteriota bacterium]